MDTLPGGELLHAFSGHREPVGVVDYMAEDGVGEGGVADDLAPLLDWNLTRRSMDAR